MLQQISRYSRSYRKNEFSKIPKTSTLDLTSITLESRIIRSKVVEDPVQDVTTGDTDDEGEVNTNLIKSAFAQKIHFRLKNEPKEVVVNNSETNALSELTEEMTEVGQITEEEAEVTDNDNSAETAQETTPETVEETPETEAATEAAPVDATPTEETPAAEEVEVAEEAKVAEDAESGVVEDVEESASIEVVKEDEKTDCK